MDEALKQLEEKAERGKRFLDRLELADAEEIFRDILQRVPAHRSLQTDRVLVTSLFGLAEIHAKHCRNVRITQLDWTCGMLFALLFYRATSETCAKIIRSEQAKGTGSSNNDHFSDTLSRAKSQSNITEASLLNGLRGKVLADCTSNYGSISIRKRATFDGNWLEELWDFCSRSALEYQTSDTPEQEDSRPNGSGVSELIEGPNGAAHQRRRRYSLVAKDLPVQTAPQPTHSMAPEDIQKDRPSSPTPSSVSSVRNTPNKRRINFDRFQDAIKQFVSDVSHDIRGKYSHISGKIPHGLLEKRVCSELALRLTPGCEDSQELQTVFETLLTEEEDDVSTADTVEEFPDEELESSCDEEDDDDEAVETIDLFVKPSANYTGKLESGTKDPVPLCNGLILYEKGQLMSVNKIDPKSVKTNKETKTNNSTKSSEISSKNSTSAGFNNSVIPTDETSTRYSSGKSGIITKWRHSDREESLIDEYILSKNTIHGFEEVTAISSRKKERSLASTESDFGLQKHINEAILSQLLALTSIKLADMFRKESFHVEASQMYRYAYGIFETYPLANGQKETLASLLVDIGSSCCSLGEMESGSQLMKEAATLYEHTGEVLKQAGVWYQLGNAHLSDSLRQESVLAKVMQMIREHVKTGPIEDTDGGDTSSECSSDEEDTYCTCIYDAIECYKRALEILDKARETGKGEDTDLLANVLTNLADCHMMTGGLGQAEYSYEAALSLFSNTFGATLLQKNAHVLGMVGTLNFLVGNYVRSATMFETSHVLRSHMPDTDEPTLEIAWNITMLALSYHFLGHHHQSVTWCIRAFKLYTRFFRGRLLTVDPLCRWFIVQNLLILGFAYNSLRLHKKTLHYLNFCKNMLVEPDEDHDPDQSVQVYLALGDAYKAVDEKTNAEQCFEDARKRLELVDKDSGARLILSEELECRLTGSEGSSVRPEGTTRDRRIHDQAIFHQRDVESSIKDDMVSILLKLGFTTTSEKDIDWAIGCYDDCVQVYRDLKEPSEAARALASLATLCQVKGSMQQDDPKRRQDFLTKAENYFREAYTLVDSASPVCVQYGNFLHGQGRFLEALQVLLPFVFCKRPDDLELTFSGIELMALPVHLRRGFEEDEALIVEARILAKFLALLCFRSLKMTKDADETLDELYHSVSGTSKSLNFTILGYAFLEFRLFQESAEAFMRASRLQPDSDLTHFVAWVALLLAAYAVLARGLDHFLQKVLESGNNDRGAWTFHEKKTYLRRQVSCRSRKVIRTSGVNQPTSNMENRLHDSSNGLPNHHDSPTQSASPSRQSPGVKRSFVIATGRWQPVETNGSPVGSPGTALQPGCDGQSSGKQEEAAKSASKKKWRSRLYHNLSDTSENDRSVVDSQ